MIGFSLFETLLVLLMISLLSIGGAKLFKEREARKVEYFIKTARTKSLLTGKIVTLQIRNRSLTSSIGRTLPLKNTSRINTQRRRIEFYLSGAASPGSVFIQNCRIIISLRGRVRSVCS